MIWLILAVGVVIGIDWRHLALLMFAVLAPLPAALLVGIHWWRARPGISLRASRFCDAASNELRAGASFRAALETAAVSVDANEVARLCQMGASMGDVARAARSEFAEVGPELGALLTRTEGMGVSPASLFDEIGGLALAQVEVAQEVSTAVAPARATGAVLLIAPILSVGWVITRGGFEAYLRQPAQRASALLGLALITAGLVSSILILRRAR